MRAESRWQHFPEHTLAQLFDAIEVDDVVEEQVSIPDHGALLCANDEQIHQCYSLCLQLWHEGVSRHALLELLSTLQQRGDLSPDERRRFKSMRAKFKHLRFAQRLFGKRHQCSGLLHRTTVMMGKLQDAFRGGHRDELQRSIRIMRLLLLPPVWALMQRAAVHFPLDSAASICDYRQQCFAGLEPAIKSTVLDGKGFHDTRKIVSQQVAYYDTFRTLYPDSDVARRMSRFLAAINGLMGDRHDEIIEATLKGERAYNDAESFSEDVRWRLETLVEALCASERGSVGKA
ncbi:hypothetical protein [Carnimonas bestiolae]|uniref:hypothetical protein n=1 Tax=Carnimonas bestiolae TaxID=3402172 RepID=UPI003EDC9D96